MKGAIFDLDGTLLDSMSFWRSVVEIYLNRKGKEITLEEKQTIDQLTVTKAGEYIKERFGFPQSAKEIEEEILSLIEANYKFNIPLKPYVHIFLNKLKKKGVKMCIATATHKYLVEYALERHNIADMFEFIITSQEVGDGKKDSPRIYEQALERLGTRKEDTIVFEDAYHAIKSAKSAGFNVVGVQDATFKHKREDIIKISDKYIKNFNEYRF